MNVSSISENSASKDLFIRYANSFMSTPNTEEIVNQPQNPETEDKEKPKGLETLTTFTIFPKQVVNGKTIITA